VIFLGFYLAGETVKYRANFHNDTGTIENPTSPAAEHESPASAFTALTAPAIINAKVGHYGGSIDSTGFAAGQHFIRMQGTVTTAKTVATEFCFEIVAFNPKVSTAGGLPIVGTGTNNFKSDSSANVTYANAAPPSVEAIRTEMDANSVDLNTIIGGLVVINADTDNIQDRLPAALVGGRMDSVVGDIYADGYVWVDTVNGVAGTTSYVNGTTHNPVNSIASARTIANNVGLKGFRIILGSVISLDQTYSGYRFFGRTWTLILNSQSCPNCYFEGAVVAGTALNTSTGVKFENCALAGITMPPFSASECVVVGPILPNAAGVWHVDSCYSGNAADGTPPIWDFGTTAAQDNDLVLNHYSGGIQLNNLGNAGTDTAAINGRGRLDIDASCVNNMVMRVRGLFNITNNGTVTLIDDANFERSIMQSAILSDATPISGVHVAAIPEDPLLAGSYTAPDNAGIVAVKTKTDQLIFTKANELDVNIQSVNDVTVTGTGVKPGTWGP
jgi:hypothetical protein